MRKITTTVLMCLIATTVYAGELTHNFKNPSFSGQGYSTHVLTIHQLEQQRKDKNKEDAQAAIDKAEREEKSTNM